jgi:uncharacterized protein (DUF2336 family)
MAAPRGPRSARRQRGLREGHHHAGRVIPHGEVGSLIRHLRDSAQVNARLVLRALLSGNVDLFEHALAELSGLPLARVSALVSDKRGAGFAAIYQKAVLPASIYSAVKEAIDAMKEGGFIDNPGGATRLRRRMVERVLTRCADEACGPRAAHHAAAPLCGRGGARRGANILRGAGS